MKKRNPICSTVTHVVRSTGGRRNKKQSTQSKFLQFFEDLENRGPHQPNSLFETWTQKIRKDMERARTWKENPKGNNFEFVTEYINRLQFLFLRLDKGRRADIHELVHGRWQGEFTREGLAFRMIYLKIRVWGLRNKQFRLRRWLKRNYWINVHRETILWPMDFKKKYEAGEKIFLYIVAIYGPHKIKKEIYKNKTLQK